MSIERFVSKVTGHILKPDEWFNLIVDQDARNRAIINFVDAFSQSPSTNDQVYARFIGKYSLMYGSTKSLETIGISPKYYSIQSEGDRGEDCGIVLKWDFKNTQPSMRFRPLYNPKSNQLDYSNAIDRLNERLDNSETLQKGIIIAGFTSQGDILNNGLLLNKDGRTIGNEIPNSKGGIALNWGERLTILDNKEMQANGGYDVRIGAPISGILNSQIGTYNEALSISQEICRSNGYTDSENEMFMFLVQKSNGDFQTCLSMTSDTIVKSFPRFTSLQVALANVISTTLDIGDRFVSFEENLIAFPRAFDKSKLARGKKIGIEYPMELWFPID